MTDLTIRVHYRDEAGWIEDVQLDMDLSEFGGVLPSIGDTILKPYTLLGQDRSDPANREIWTVVQRVFNPRDQKDYVALVVEFRPATNSDPWVPG